ncbi:MAG: VOC family protein [bacterium]|nr:VOC family protein [bacterium]
MRKAGFFDIYVNEIDRAQKFYEAVLATKLQPMDDPNDSSVEMRMFGDDFQSHGAGGALVKMQGVQPGPGGTMIYFTCEDCAVEEARVAQAGGKIVRPKFPIGEHGFVSLASDTEGNMIGLHSMK